jgi:hypothetical protein
MPGVNLHAWDGTGALSVFAALNFQISLYSRAGRGGPKLARDPSRAACGAFLIL